MRKKSDVLPVTEIKDESYLKKWAGQKRLLSKLEKLVSNEVCETGDAKIYHMNSPIGAKTEKMTVTAPLDFELYVYPYKQPQPQQLVFATKKHMPIILSIIQKNDVGLHYKWHVDVTQVGWLDRFESVQVLKRLVSNPENVQIGDCKIHRGLYPIYDGVRDY